MKTGGGDDFEKSASILKKVEEIYEKCFNVNNDKNRYIYTAIMSSVYKWAKDQSDEIKTNLINIIGASPQATFYHLMKKENNIRSCLINEMGLGEISKCSDTEECEVLKSYNTYYENLHALTGSKEIDINIDKFRKDMLKRIPADYKNELEKIYNDRGGNDRLYIDLLSVFCKLFEENEYEQSDFKFFKEAVDHYKDVDSFFHSGLNTGFFHSLVGVFPLSDSFLYVPGIKPYDNCTMPSPNERTLFSVQPRIYTGIFKGGNVSGTFFGGVMSGTMGGNDNE